MKITEARYSMKRSNGNYGTDEVSLVATVAPDENPEHAVAKLKLLCEQQLHGEEWAASYRRAQAVLEAGTAPPEVLAEASRAASRYEDWANAVGDVRREVMT